MDIGTALDFFVYSKGITSFNALDQAFAELSAAIDTEQYGVEHIIQGILDQDLYLLETVLVSRGLGDTIQCFLAQHASSSLVTSPQPYLDVLKSFSATFQTLRSPLDVPAHIYQLGDVVEKISAALFATISFSSDGRRKKAIESNAKLPSRVKDVDLETALRKVNCAPPNTQEEASRTAEVLARRLANIMKTYLEFLVTPSAKSTIRATFIKNFSKDPRCSALSGLPNALSSNFIPVPEDVLAHIGDRAEEGKWLIVLARRALRHLRQFSTQHSTIYNVAISKLEELSAGLFSRSNHARFLGNKFSVPLFAAALVDGISIIYHIDCGGPSASQSKERQFIRVFDLDDPQKPLWRLVAMQLQGRSAIYRQRCTARNAPQRTLSGSYRISPLDFDRDVKDDEEFAKQTEYVSTENERKLLELHRVLALEKFIPYSRDLIDAVEHDKDGTFIFSVSPTERDIIEHRSSCLVLGRSGTGKTTTMMFKMLLYEKSARQSGISFRQVFVTQSPMLAEKVKEYYRRLENRSLDLNVEQEGDSSAIEPFTFDGMNRGNRQDHEDLPKRWKELEDDDFPLFLSYDELCNLLAADLGFCYDPEMADETAYKGSKKSARTRQGKITFRHFLSRIWPFLGSRRYEVDPLLLFNEFIGVIKGSEMALATDSGFLDRSAYEKLRSRTYPVFADRRALVYDLFLRYLRYKPKGSWDVADRSHALIRAIRDDHYRNTIDFVYVDEAQDNLVADTALLRTLCPNPHGLFFAGDTAQAVSAGNTFRFNDLKAFLYRLERQDHLVTSGRRKAIDPHFFTLSINYRSHAGIIEPAAFLIESLTRLFPGSIDIMARERALVRGPKPVFFSSRGTQTPFDSFVSDQGGSDMEFGADQVIIVRDEVACDKLRQKIGRHAGMVMTLYASKGQEFNDVLIYDFFADSLATQSNWKALLKAHSSMQSGEIRPLEACDAIIQSELKCLYVGLTRAREHVWFWDSTDQGVAFESILVQAGLAHAASAQDVPQSIGVKSSTREWALRGKECFQREDYFNASVSFERAGLAWWKAVADAFEHKRLAEALSIQDPSHTRLLKQSAEEISACAVRAPTTRDREQMTAIAAACFIQAREHKSAARLLYELRRYDEATWNFRLAGAFKKAVFVIQQHEAEMDSELVEDVKYVSALVFVRRNDNELAKSLFPTLETYAEFLEENHFYGHYAAALLELSRHEEAAKVFLRLGRQSDAVGCFLESRDSELRAKAPTCLINSLFIHISLKKAKESSNQSATDSESPEENSKEFCSLLKLGSRMVLSVTQAVELRAANAVQLMDPNQLRSCAHQHAETYPHVSLVCLDKLLTKTSDHILGKGPASITSVISLLRDYVLYGRLVRMVTQDPHLVQRSNFQRIFGLIQAGPEIVNDVSADGIVVLRHSLIYSRDLARKTGIRTETGTLIPADIAAENVRKALIRKHSMLLEELAKTLDDRKNQSPFNVCLYQVRQGRCSATTCDKYHPSAEALSTQGFNQRMELHLLVLSALEGLTGSLRRRAQGIWLQRLFETCYPPENRLGSISWLRSALIPQYDSLLSAAKIWCEDNYRTMGREWTFFLANAIGCALFGSTLDYRNATNYIPRAEWQRAAHKGDYQRHLEAALGWFSCSSSDRHTFGITFIQHAVHDEFQIDVLTLTSFAEEVIGHLIYNYFLLSKNQDREALLPRSWALRACQQGVSPMTVGPGSSRIIEALSKLLPILLTKEEDERPDEGERKAENGKPEVHAAKPLKLHYRGAAIGRVSRSVRISATVKVCRMMALVGQNFGDPALMSNIMEAFGQIKHYEPTPHYLYQSFTEATTWEQVLKALSELAQRTPSDPLLTIAEKLPLRHRSRPAGTRILRCLSAEGLSAQLGLAESSLPLIPNHPKQVPEPERKKQGAPGVSTHHATTDHVDPDPTEWDAKLQAASRIFHYWKRYRRRCDEKLAKLKSPLWEAYRRRAHALSPGREARIYGAYLQTSVPKVFIYLRRIIDQCKEAKDGLITEQSSAHHGQLEEIRKRIKLFRNLHGDIKAIEESIAPDAPLHSKCSLHSLEDEIQKVVALRRKATGLHPGFKSLDEDYREGVESLLSKLKLTQTKPLRPALNVDEEDYGPA